jgi:gliding motility-associated-like protein
MYVGDNSLTRPGVYKMNSDGTGQTRIDNNLTKPAYVAFDNNGNLYIGDQVAQALYEIPAGGTQTQVASGLGIIVSVKTDASGNVYIAGRGVPNEIYCYSPGTGLTNIDSFLTNGLMTDASYNLYYALGTVNKITPTGGYFTSPQLPAGLIINPGTGAINGTPTAVSPAADYTVTAFNFGASDTANVNITVTSSAPAISYATPQVFVQNTAVTPLSPVSLRTASPGYLSTPAATYNFSFPFGTATDLAGNVYVANKSSGGIIELLAGGGQATVGTGLSTPAAVAVDKAGNVYSANQGNNTVVEIHAHTGTKTFIGSGYQHPAAVAVDSAGNVFVADQQGAAGVVYKIKPGHAKQLFKGGFIDPNGLAIDATGNVYVSDGGAGSTSMVYKVTADGITQTSLAGSFNEATGVAIDASSNIFVSDGGNADIIEYPAGGGSPITITAGLTFNFGLSADGAGNLYVADPGANKVVKLTPAGGYFINRALPAGLSFDTATGTVSGTPVVASPATVYTVTAYNAIGESGAAPVNITVLAADATLAALITSNSKLSPAFAPAKTSYQLKVGNIDFFTVTPVAADPAAAITVNGTTVASGAVSQNIPLNIGSNQVQIVVTAIDHTTQKTYTIAVTRVPSVNANLSNLRISNARLSPAFNKDSTSYTASVGLNKVSIIATPVAAHATTAIMVNGQLVSSGTGSDPITLGMGLDTITTVVTAQDGITKKTYTVVINHGSANANIIAIRLSKGALSPAFRQADTSYTAEVDNSVSSLTVRPRTSDSTAMVTVNSRAVASGTASAPIPLNVGQDTIRVKCLAANGINNKTYTIVVTRDGPAPANSVYQPVSYTRPVTAGIAEGIRVHQGLSPNGDGVNDVLVIDGITSYPDNKLSIMSRSGELVFEVNGYDNTSKAFDGHSNKNGKMQSPGTYFYSLDYTAGGVVKHKTGFIVLKW